MAKISKKANYILIPAVLILWGGVFWKVKKGIGKEPEALAVNEIEPFIQTESAIQNDTLKLVLDYPDPFLRRSYRTVPKKKDVIASTKKKTPKKKKEPIVWPSVSYKGFIKNNQKEKTLCVLYINEQSHLMTESQTVNEIELVKVAKDSVLLVYKGEQKYFHKK